MYLLIEYSGHTSGTAAAERIQRFAEEEFGATCEQIVGDRERNEVIVYDENQKVIGMFGENPSEDTMRFTLAMAYDEEDN